MWNGSIVKRGKFTDHFKIISIAKHELFGYYAVDVLFYSTPDKTYTFEIDDKVFKRDKEVIGKEILRQMTND